MITIDCNKDKYYNSGYGNNNSKNNNNSDKKRYNITITIMKRK